MNRLREIWRQRRSQCSDACSTVRQLLQLVLQKITNYLTHYGMQHLFARNMIADLPSVSLTDPHEAPLKVEIFKLTPTWTYYSM